MIILSQVTMNSSFELEHFWEWVGALLIIMVRQQVWTGIILAKTIVRSRYTSLILERKANLFPMLILPVVNDPKLGKLLDAKQRDNREPISA